MADRETARWACFVIVRNERGEILLQQRTGKRYLSGYWDFPSGHGEFGEDIRVTALRELKEELGLDGKLEDIRLVHIEHYFVEVNYFNFTFVLHKWTGVPKICEPDRCAAIGWFAEDALPEKSVNAVRSIADTLGGFGDGLTYSTTDADVYYGQMKFPQQDV